MLERWTPARRNWALAILGALLLYFAWTVRSALNPLLLGLLLAYILHPMVLKLERRGWSRKTAVNVIFGAVLAAAVLLTLALVLQWRALWRDVVEERRSLDHIRNQVVSGVDQVTRKLEELGLRLEPGLGGAQDHAAPQPAPQGPPPGAEAGEPERERMNRRIVDELFERARLWLQSDEGRADAAQAGIKAAGGIWLVLERLFGSVLALLTLLVLVPLYTWFLLFELERVSTWVAGYIPLDQRARWSRIGEQMAEMLGGFFRGRLLVCLLKGVLITVLLALAGIPYALLIGMLSGFLALIPVVGPGIGYVLAMALALLEFEPLSALTRVVLVATLGEVIEGYVMMPKVLGERMGLHPVVVLASLMIFGSALGLFGLLLALPLTAACVILARELVLPGLKAFAEGRGKA